MHACFTVGFLQNHDEKILRSSMRRPQRREDKRGDDSEAGEGHHHGPNLSSIPGATILTKHGFIIPSPVMPGLIVW